MDKNEILLLNSDELYKRLITMLMGNLTEGFCFINKLAELEHYQKNYEFRITVETAKAVGLTFQGNFAQVISLCTGLVERATALKLWKFVATNYNLLGGAYQTLGALERAMENYYRVIKVESEHSLLDVSSLAYNNIGLMYISLMAYDKAYEYLQLAIEVIEKNKKEQSNYFSKKMIYLSSLMSVLCYMNRLEEADQIFEQLKDIDTEQLKPNISPIRDFHVAQMVHAFYREDFWEAKRILSEIKGLIPKDNKLLMQMVLNEYIYLCGKFDISFDFYETELMEAERMPNTEYMAAQMETYIQLRKYYQYIGDEERYKKVNEKYVMALESDEKSILSKQLNALLAVESLIESKENIAEITSENTELKLIAEEANYHKNALQEAYQRIEMINELGQKMISSLNLEEVLELIYQNLKANISINSFSLMVIDWDKNEMRSVINYEGGVLQPEFTIKLDNENSVLVECYRKNEMIHLKNIPMQENIQKRKFSQIGQKQSKSAVFMPLNVENRTIGIFSIQDKKANAYTEKDIVFLKELQPYLAIALNNAVRSWTLEHEIQQHLETQSELKKANQRLSEISSLDGLTQISSRRDFEVRILELLKKSKKQKQTCSIFMFDIDNFKLYNDTYGHLDGDRVLKSVAKIIRHHLDRVGGLSARFGGEEFIGACGGLSEQDSQDLAEQIRLDIQALDIENKEAPLKRVTISIGIAIVKNVGNLEKSELMRQADISLYQAKNTGKNKVVLSKMISKNDK